MNKAFIEGEWRGSSINGDLSQARFFEAEVLDTKKTDPLGQNPVYKKIVRCEIKAPHMKHDIFATIIKENTEKYYELLKRFPKAWQDFVNKGGGFKSSAEVKTGNIEKETNTTIDNKIAELKKEYEELEDKRSKRGFEIRDELKKAGV